MRLVILYAVAVIFGSRALPASAEDSAYDLQERCGATVRSIYGEQDRNVSEGNGTKVTHYENNYYAPLNTCIALVDTTYINNDHLQARQSLLIDVSRNKLIASLFINYMEGKPSMCSFLKVSCNSEAEYNSKVASYLK